MASKSEEAAAVIIVRALWTRTDTVGSGRPARSNTGLSSASRATKLVLDRHRAAHKGVSDRREDHIGDTGTGAAIITADW
jgi:hypothetical protein